MIVSAGVALWLSLALSPLLIAVLSRLGIVDRPNHRSSHSQPTLRGGGAAIAIAALVALTATHDVSGAPLRALVVAAVLFGLLGLLEDVRGVPALARLAVQTAIAAIALVWLLDGMTGGVLWTVVFGAGVVVWLVGFVNAFNFMDGINGISVAEVLVAGATFALIGRSRSIDALEIGGALAAGAAVGFLPFNFPKARLFLGDVGSYFLGAWLAVLVVLALRHGIPIEAALAPLALYVADTAVTLVRRVRRGETWHEAHHEHAYQRLVERGWSHASTTGLVAGCIALCSALGVVSLTAPPVVRAAADAAIVVVLGFYLALPSLLDHRTAPTPLSRPRAAGPAGAEAAR